MPKKFSTCSFGNLTVPTLLYVNGSYISNEKLCLIQNWTERKIIVSHLILLLDPHARHSSPPPPPDISWNFPQIIHSFVWTEIKMTTMDFQCLLSWFEFPRNNGHNFLWIISFLITQLSAFGIPIKQTFVPLFDIYFWNALKIFWMAVTLTFPSVNVSKTIFPKINPTMKI